MWKLISLCLLIVAQAAEIQDLYGEWIEVAFYPASTYAPICIRFAFDKSLDNEQCVYADGRNATSVLVFMMTEKYDLLQRASMPIMIVDTAAEVMPALNISCRCGDKEVRDRAVARLINDKYFILYQNISPSMEYTRTDKEQNFAILFGKEVVPDKTLFDFMTNIEELKNRRGAVMCATENYGGFKTTENKV